MRTTAICLLAALLVTLLCACAGGTTTGTTTAGGTTTAVGTTSASMTTSAAVTTSKATSGSASGTTSGKTSSAATSSSAANSSSVSALKPEDAQIMYNNTLYNGTKEEVRNDELGKELMAVTLVTATPKANGEASGVTDKSKLYAIKNVTDDSAIAFDCGGTYYRATKKA